MNAQNTQEPKAETVPTANGNTRIVHRTKGGLFAKKPKPPSAEKVMQAVAAKITSPLDETGRTHYEEVINAQLEIAKDTNIERGTASTKAAEFIHKAAGFLAKPEEHRNQIKVVYIGDMGCKDLTEEEKNYKKPTQPSFIHDAEFITNPPLLTAEQLRPDEPKETQ